MTSCLFTEMTFCPVYSSTICEMSSVFWSLVLVSAGRLTSMPCCDSGRAAMKMTSSTSSTSIIGVMFMSPLASSFLAVMTFSAPM